MEHKVIKKTNYFLVQLYKFNFMRLTSLIIIKLIKGKL